MDKISILGVDVSKGLEAEVLERVMLRIEKTSDPFYIVTPNPEMIVKAQQDNRFREVLNQAGFALPDGVGIALAAKILGIKGISRITGVDFMDSLCKDSSKKAVSVGFLGGRDGVAERAAKCLIRRYPDLKIAFVAEEWSDEGFARAEKIKDERLKIKEDKLLINRTSSIINQVDILFVAFGFPKQEFWMSDQRGKLPVKMMMGVGGAFDYISGDVPRAPKLLRDLGFEWLFRLAEEPWRVKRQLSLVSFIFLVIKRRFPSF